MAYLRIKELLLELKRKGKKPDIEKISKRIYPNMNKQSARNAFYTLGSNTKPPKTVRTEWIDILCEELETDPNGLFGY